MKQLLKESMIGIFFLALGYMLGLPDNIDGVRFGLLFSGTITTLYAIYRYIDRAWLEEKNIAKKE